MLQVPGIVYFMLCLGVKSIPIPFTVPKLNLPPFLQSHFSPCSLPRFLIFRKNDLCQFFQYFPFPISNMRLSTLLYNSMTHQSECQQEQDVLKSLLFLFLSPLWLSCNCVGAGELTPRLTSHSPASTPSRRPRLRYPSSDHVRPLAVLRNRFRTRFLI